MTVETRQLIKDFGSLRAVDRVDFAVPDGSVTALVGPNGSGKTTTLRMLLGLVAPTAGTALIDGVRYADLPAPRRAVGAVLGSDAFHGGRTARAHLRIACLAAGFPPARVDEVLDAVGLTDSADRRVTGYSLGMRQRLAVATALLGDPRLLVLDEPTNGLDPAGVRWLRTMLRGLADSGRTILISSHLLAEVARSADRIVVLSEGRLRYSGPISSLAGGSGSLEEAFFALVEPTGVTR